jgi:hypothetical protein
VAQIGFFRILLLAGYRRCARTADIPQCKDDWRCITRRRFIWNEDVDLEEPDPKPTIEALP